MNFKYTLVFILVISRVIMLFSFNHDYISGDSSDYVRMAKSKELFDLKKYFNPSEDHLTKLRNYDFDTKDLFPFHDVSQSVFWEPGYPLLLKTVFAVTSSKIVARGLQYFLSIFILFLLYRILHISINTRNSFFFFVLALAHPFFLSHPLLLYTEVFDAFLIIGIYYYLVQDKLSDKALMIIGTLAGILAITESFYLPLLILIPFLIAFFYKRTKTIFLYLIPFFLIVTPVFIHNYLYTDGAFLLSTKTSYNFWLDNNHLKVSTMDRGEVGNPLPQDYFLNKDLYKDIRKPCEVKLANQHKCESLNAIKFALNNKTFFIKRAFEKWINLWSPNLFTFNHGFNLSALNLTHIPAKWLHNIFIIFEGLFFLIFLFSLPIILTTKKKLNLLIIGHLLFIHGVVAWGHGMVRYRYAIVPILFLCIFSAMSDINLDKVKSKKVILLSLMGLSIFIIVLTNKIPIIWMR